MIQSAFDAGSVSRVDVLSAQSQVANDETLLPSLRQQLSAARHALSVLMGQAPGNWQAPIFQLTNFELPATLPVALPSELAHQRPDILAAEAQLHAATAAVGVATANLYPRITLSASFSQQSLEAGELFNASNRAWSLISGLTAPIFDGGRLRAEQRAARAQVQAEAARYQQVVLQSFAQVADALDALSHDEELLAAQRQASGIAEQNLSLTRDSYSEGNVGVLQVLDSERAYQQAKLGYVRAQAQRLQDTARLFLSLGGSAPQASLTAVAVATN
ncbi:MAG: efflux transporter outer membrane subunit [Steroidobacteraceae bacterium]